MNQPVATLNITDDVISKLISNGFYHCCDLEESGAHNLSNATKSALDLYQDESQIFISTFIPQLDAIFTHKIVAGAITELTGLPGSGKTQICLHLAVGAKSGTIFISTNNSLAPHRLAEIAQAYVQDAEAVLKQIYCIEAADPAELMKVTEFLGDWLSNNTVDLLIIDSISWILRQKPFMDRTGFIYTIFQNLRKLAHLHSFSIIVTNDFTTKISGNSVCNVPAFGDSFYHIVNNRVLISRTDDIFNAKIVKGGRAEVNFMFK